MNPLALSESELNNLVEKDPRFLGILEQASSLRDEMINSSEYTQRFDKADEPYGEGYGNIHSEICSKVRADVIDKISEIFSKKEPNPELLKRLLDWLKNPDTYSTFRKCVELLKKTSERVAYALDMPAPSAESKVISSPIDIFFQNAYKAFTADEALTVFLGEWENKEEISIDRGAFSRIHSIEDVQKNHGYLTFRLAQARVASKK